MMFWIGLGVSAGGWVGRGWDVLVGRVVLVGWTVLVGWAVLVGRGVFVGAVVLVFVGRGVFVAVIVFVGPGVFVGVAAPGLSLKKASMTIRTPITTKMITVREEVLEVSMTQDRPFLAKSPCCLVTLRFSWDKDLMDIIRREFHEYSRRNLDEVSVQFFRPVANPP